MVGIDEVARAAGVSTATVSRALSGKHNVSDSTRERVQEAAQRLGLLFLFYHEGWSARTDGARRVVNDILYCLYLFR